MLGLNPWAILGGVLFFIASVTGAYFYGHSQGVDSEKAKLADTYSAALVKFSGDAAKAAKEATTEALKDFNDRLDVLNGLAADMRKTKGIMDASAAKLSSSLKGGACVLSPAQRQLLECLRRPSDPGCGPPAAVPH